MDLGLVGRGLAGGCDSGATRAPPARTQEGFARLNTYALALDPGKA